jgi:hypothetical protein
LASGLKDIDLSRSPPDFAEAYIRYANAWDALAVELKSEPQNIGEQLISGFIRGLDGKLDGGASDMMDARKRCLIAIHDARTEVEATAVRHGARLSANH